jgi:hypothetical protein
MRRLLILVLAFVWTLPAEDVAFQKVRMLVPEWKKGRLVERQVDLVFTDGGGVRVLRKGAEIKSVPAANIDKISYDFAKRHRVAEGAIVMAASLGAGAVTMLTKTTSHWLAVEYHEANEPKLLTLRLDKSDYRAVISAAEARTGKKVEIATQGGGPERVTKGSTNVDQVVAFPVEKVEAAARKAMEANSCTIGKQEPGLLDCNRPVDGEIYKGEKVVVTFTPEGAGTHVRVETRKGVMGRAMKKNWSKPVFDEMMRLLAS